MIGRQHVLPRDRARAHQQGAGDLSEELIERLAGLGAQREHLLRVPVEQLPGPCRNGLPAEAVEEPSAELLLEEPDVLAHRGLGEPEGRRGPREAPELVYAREHLELPEVHVRQRPRSGLGAQRPGLLTEPLHVAELDLFVPADEVGEARDPHGALVALGPEVAQRRARSSPGTRPTSARSIRRTRA